MPRRAHQRTSVTEFMIFDALWACRGVVTAGPADQGDPAPYHSGAPELIFPRPVRGAAASCSHPRTVSQELYVLCGFKEVKLKIREIQF